MKKLVIFIGIACLLAFSAAPVYAQPPLPHAFYGSVTINNSLAPVGTRVEARGTDVERGVAGNPITTTVRGIYGTANPFEPRLIVQGDIEEGATITFYVNGVSTGQTAAWHSGEVTKLNLAVTITPPPVGGGGPGVGDTTPPTISDILVSNITKTSADISWKTDEKSDSQVEYWSSPSKLSPLDTERVINHLVRLTDLTPATTYHYKTMSRDAAGNLAVSDVHSFTTLGLPATFTTSDLSISPAEVDIGEEVTISAKVANTGDVEGTYEVTLKINGVIEETKKVDVDAGASKMVTFTTAKDVAGTYSVAVDGLSGSFTVKEKPAPPEEIPPEEVPPVKVPINWPLIGGIIAGVVIVGLLVLFLVRRRAA